MPIPCKNSGWRCHRCTPRRPTTVSYWPARPLTPAIESWSPRVELPEVHIDLALDNNGNAEGSAGLRFQALHQLAAVRLRISPLLQVTDVRWSTGPALQAAGCRRR